jgi:hypothetical protein
MAQALRVIGRFVGCGIKGRGLSVVMDVLHARFPFLLAFDGQVRKGSAAR